MSAAPARQFRPVTAPHPSAPSYAPAPRTRDHLRAVAAPKHARSLVPFTWACFSMILGALAAVLVLNTTMAEGAYERRDLKIELADLHQQRATLISELEANASPQWLSTRAAQLGMEPAGTLGFVSIEDGTVLESGN
ncbi:MAG: hypothetical protein CVT64_08420 [Actinobacteria bacterium HGW-Actinobacteria-4]|nr:MAG: hypothetical protein CVT64_08420 [Actinobacteria bacterium HGW-Actinobacteria-4]